MTVPILQVIREVQIPLVAVMLLVACLTKALRILRTGSLDSGLGPTALFPLSMRRPIAMTVCATEAGLGLGLIATAGSKAAGVFAAATIARLGTGLLFLVATSALIELRAVRPDVGCGCFGDFSTAPVSGRTIARSALLAVAILSTIGLRTIGTPPTGSDGLVVLAIVCAELLLIGFLSPEVGAGLIRLGYSEPCELRDVPSARTLAALRRSKQWRQHGGLIASDVPADIWRELCWRYVVYPSSYEGRRADLVFAVYLQYRRPVVHAALVDSGTGLVLPWPAGSGRKRRTARWLTSAARTAGAAAAARTAGAAAAATTAGAAAATSAARAADSVGAGDSVGAVDTAPMDEVPRQAEATADLPFSTRL
jgi:methylamine utilization protein MauE